MYKLYENIRNRRIELGMTQDELAKLTGYTDRSSIAKIEAGKVDLTRSKIMLFADVLQMSPTDLMGWTPEEEPEVYYTDEGVAEIAQQIVDNPNMRALFDAARDCTPEDMQLITDMIERFKKTNPDG